ncbi:hypothetical protein [Methanosarcina mazei]|jgi:hypothetical protein|uniref:DUF2127 domain-containing protein n=3 Tax=Methanosarcina mazei TaxID=2209 RepID=A0A0F8N833_METMZ|nr:hypothetical protein [Methanosarcina mazei]AKB40560.1 hypothetical protein MSMAW_1569 [Methanosarcina mazei WWM610]AKB72860.1 hypothetical protein MSMAC_2970 [Methanosarcina mazei C16]KKF98981.1 hypothetical protein DU40_11740 [Methanosarcina mazei]KKG13857.1 hypothetical protein DU34_04965 [Methanosarcina mazei]KKG26633.1 hypothetical protein DU52_18920 [Methanosarcina mazei]
MDRPVGVTILAFLAVLLAFLNAIAMLRFLGFLPFLGVLDVRIFNFWYALMYGLLAYVWAWVAQMLWQVDRQAWLFLAVITVFNLCLAFVVLVTGGSWYDINVTVIVNTLILIYIMLPGVRDAFGTD